MDKMKILIALMAIILNNAMANAKLTIAVVDKEYYNFVGMYLNCCKFRQAYIDLYGEETYIDFLLKENRDSNAAFSMAFVGEDGDMMLGCHKPGDKDYLIRIKNICDHMSEMGDTLYTPETYCVDLLYIINRRRMPKWLLVGQPPERNIRMILYTIPLAGTYDGFAYWQECKKLNYHYFSSIEDDFPRNTELFEKSFEYFYRYIRSMDKILLSLHIGPTKIYDFFSYEYDENAQVRYIEQEFIHD